MTFIENMQGRDLAILQALDGREITYIPSNGNPLNGNARIISGMLQEFTEMVAGESVEILSSDPVLSVRTIDIPEIQVGDVFTIDGQDYEVSVIRPDNEGLTQLILEVL